MTDVIKDLQKIQYKGDYINGQFIQPDIPDGTLKVVSPGDLDDEVIDVEFKYDHVEMAAKAARSAFLSWAEKPFEERRDYLLRLKEIFISRKEDLAMMISREIGKPLWESRTEVQAMIGKIDITLGHSIRLVSQYTLENALPNVTGRINYKPRGAMVVLGPFNFPGHLPNGHYVPALATGNTVIFKPSDKSPGVGQLIAECFDEAEFPPGVFNLVQGDANTGRKLVISENIEGVLFTGSYEVGLKIKQETVHHFWKILALEMGGKNATVLWEDADVDKAVYESLLGSFLTTGQRCSCTSRIFLHEKIYDRFLEKFYESAKKVAIGHWSNPDVFMGSLIDGHSVEKYLRFQEIAKREETEQLMRGKTLDIGHKGYYVTPSINIVKKFDAESIYQKSEIFGPNVAIYKVNDFDETIKYVNSSSYGLSLAVFTKQKELFQKAVLRARVGLVNWNRTTNGASSKLPFGGMGKSGNDRPSGDFAVQYCTVPVSSLEDETDFDPTKIMPGIELV